MVLEMATGLGPIRVMEVVMVMVPMASLLAVTGGVATVVEMVGEAEMVDDK